MTGRINPYAAAPDTLKAWMGFSNQVAASGLEKPLLELVKIRASQINGCANCLNMHTYEARQAGEAEQRIAVLAAWREAPCYTDRERAALAWTEHMTLVADRGAAWLCFAEDSCNSMTEGGDSPLPRRCPNGPGRIVKRIWLVRVTPAMGRDVVHPSAI